MKDDDGIKSTSITAQNNPIPTSSITRKRRFWSTNLRIDLARSKIRRENQVKAWALSIFPSNEILSRKLLFYDKIIAKTNVLRRPSPPSPPFDSFLHRTKKKTSLSNRTRTLGARTLEKLSRLFSRSTLFIDREIRSSPIQIINIPKESVRLSNFTACRINQRCRPSLPHDLIHHMTPRSRSLICQLSSFTSTFKKAQSTKDTTISQIRGEINPLPFSL